MPSSQKFIQYVIASYARDRAALGPVLRALPLNATSRQVLSLSRAEQLAYLENLWRFNSQTSPTTANGQGAIYTIRKTAGLLRRFNQLPCTVGTRKARADLLAHRDPKTCRVLVLGDDDLLSVELCQRGFTKVTVADYDDRLLDRIRRETSEAPAQPHIVKADFYKPFTAPEPADVVFLDPPYSPEGASAFLNIAIDAAAPASTLYLMINPYVLGDQFRALKQIALDKGFELKAQKAGFNAYPIGSVEQTILQLAWWHYMQLPLAQSRTRTLHFYSDCFELQRS